jgi:DNA-binding MarR family transcriptional regulator
MNGGPASNGLKLDSFLPYRLSVASNAVSRLIAGAYQERFGLTVPQWRLVAVLKEYPGSTQQDLVGLTLMDKVAVSRAAGVLEARGLIARTADERDGRAWQLSLTAQGARLHGEVAPLARAYEDQLIEGLALEEVEQLEGLLRRIEARAEVLARPVRAAAVSE